jgi:hypothetical protein
MNLKGGRAIFNALFPRPASAESVERRIRQNRQRLVSIYSRGNPTLRRGRYTTESDIAKRKQRMTRRS